MTFIEYLNEKSKINIAQDFAQEKHFYQYRKFSKEPYFKHPSRVADIVSRFTNNEDIIIAAYTHDTLEDTKTTQQELDAVFGPKILKIVQELTSIKSQIDKVGKADYLLKKMQKMSPQALLIKLADRLDNVSDFKVASRKFIDKYIKETDYILNNLTRSLKLEHRNIIKEITIQIEMWR